MEIPTFLTTEEALYIHAKEIEAAGGAGGLKDFMELEAAINAPRAAIEDTYLMDIFAMAATYIEAICTRHPFMDGNKRTGTACALTFLYLNGFEVEEAYEEELADRVVDLVMHKIDKGAMTEYLRENSSKVS